MSLLPDDSFVLVLTTIGGGADAAALAGGLVAARLAACVNVLPPMRSFYRWQGAVADEVEQQLVIKTIESALPALEAHLAATHPYDLPEFVVLRGAASRAYRQWVGESVD